ncbi:MAG: DUF4298 domain-containing protein [Clostridia bacterium]|nr:DUF4298 domain-containing protein [Clostridia bacterium]
MSDLARIREMENCLDECDEAVRLLREQIDRMKELREKAIRLFAYYGSEAWYADRESELPEGFKAGVFSEDAVYDSLTELRETAFQMLETGTDVLKNWI